MLYFCSSAEALARISHVYGKNHRSRFLRRVITVIIPILIGDKSCNSDHNVFATVVSAAGLYNIEHLVSSNSTFLYYGQNTKYYYNDGLEQYDLMLNTIFCTMNLLVTLELTVRKVASFYFDIHLQTVLQFKTHLFLISAGILFLQTFVRVFADANLLLPWSHLLEAVALFLQQWALSSLTKKEQYIMMIYD